MELLCGRSQRGWTVLSWFPDESRGARQKAMVHLFPEVQRGPVKAIGSLVSRSAAGPGKGRWLTKPRGPAKAAGAFDAQHAGGGAAQVVGREDLNVRGS